MDSPLTLVPWYLEKEDQLDGSRNCHDSSTTILSQPWRKYWPPKSSGDLDLWLHSESPEVLSWRFDPSSPFDRPWRVWTKAPRAAQEQDALNRARDGLVCCIRSDNGMPS